MSRYKKPRKYIDWTKNYSLRTLKMLVLAIRTYEGLGCIPLWHRVEELTPRIIELVLGDVGVTFKMIRDLVYEKFGTPITPQKLFQRADKAARYNEFNSLKDQVFQAYRVAAGLTDGPNARKLFIDSQVLSAARRQRGACFVCRAPFDRYNQPVGDHKVAVAQGGDNNDRNCAALCPNCNQRKGPMILATFIKKFREDGQRGRSNVAAILEQEAL